MEIYIWSEQFWQVLMNYLKVRHYLILNNNLEAWKLLGSFPGLWCGESWGLFPEKHPDLSQAFDEMDHRDFSQKTTRISLKHLMRWIMGTLGWFNYGMMITQCQTFRMWTLTFRLSNLQIHYQHIFEITQTDKSHISFQNLKNIDSLPKRTIRDGQSFFRIPIQSK